METYCLSSSVKPTHTAYTQNMLVSLINRVVGDKYENIPSSWQSAPSILMLVQITFKKNMVYNTCSLLLCFS